VSMQNARMINYLLAKHGIPFIEPSQLAHLPLYLAERRAAIFFGMPWYIYWHETPSVGRLFPHRTDAGSLLLAECFGYKRSTLVKDVDGLYDKNPNKNSGATFIDKISVSDIKNVDLKHYLSS
jgi:molybdenum storage protein